MIKNKDYKELAQTIALRSICNVRVGCVIYDSYGIFAWGWNHPDNGFGICAERFAIRRSNKKRLINSNIVIVSIRKKSNKLIPSLPCDKCVPYLKFYQMNIQAISGITRDWINYKINDQITL